MLPAHLWRHSALSTVSPTKSQRVKYIKVSFTSMQHGVMGSGAPKSLHSKFKQSRHDHFLRPKHLSSAWSPCVSSRGGLSLCHFLWDISSSFLWRLKTSKNIRVLVHACCNGIQACLVYPIWWEKIYVWVGWLENARMAGERVFHFTRIDESSLDKWESVGFDNVYALEKVPHITFWHQTLVK